MVSTVDLDKYLTVSSPSHKWVRDKVIYLLTTGSSIPSFSAAAQKLSYLTQNPKTSIEEISGVISMDPGLATRCVGVASSAYYGARTIDSIDQALMMIGLEEVRRIAFTVGVMDSFSHLRIKIDWNRFWMHSILVARLTHKTASAFRECTGASSVNWENLPARREIPPEMLADLDEIEALSLAGDEWTRQVNAGKWLPKTVAKVAAVLRASPCGGAVRRLEKRYGERLGRWIVSRS
ncbi:MAG: HDOD domain-containing protein [Opitutaceae bacterium]|nr:HDOD domain-containing protein [Verrucomicrobiales bacterium]